MVVSSCGNKRITTSDDYFTVDLCERSSVMSNSHSTEIPVVFRDIIYRNKYCAICNNPSENFTEIKTATVDFNCVNKTRNDSDHWQHYDQPTEFDLANYNCNIKFNFSNVENFSELAYRYTCFKNTRPEIVCNSDVADAQFDFNYLRSTCQKYRAYIRHEPSGTEYYNPHCAMCNGHSDPYNFTQRFKLYNIEPFETFVRMVMSNQLTETIVCVGGSLYDHKTGTCVTLTCPPGYVGLRDKSCARLNVTVPQMLSEKRDATIYLVIMTENKEFGQVDQEHVIRDIGVDIVVN
ncbi:hypothetical protein LSAT2_000254, partial [Lamellibrachia satsuma]